MTAQKHKKKRVRQRMAKTGESYQAALRRVSAAANTLGGAEPWAPGMSTAPEAYTTAAVPSRDEASIRARSDSPPGFATMRRRLDATPLCGRRVRLAGELRADAVTGWAGLWVRADLPDGTLLARADQQPRVSGSQPFTRHTLVLDVPEEAARIVFGCRLEGGGAVTAKDFALEVVTKRVPLTAGNWQGGWIPTGTAPPTHYEMRLLQKDGGGTIRARCESPSGFATIMRSALAAPYRGRRLRFAADVEMAVAIGSAGIWMRIDAEDDRWLAFDSTEKPVSCPQPWRRHALVLDVPHDAARICTGYLLHGGGEISARRVELSVVGDDVETTAGRSEGWGRWGTALHAYEMNLVSEDGHGIIRAASPSPPGFATFSRQMDAAPYRGRRVRFRARVRAEEVTEHAALWLRCDDAQGNSLGFDSLQQRAPIVGTQPFTQHHVVLDVPEAAARLFFGYLLDGTGEIEAADLAIEVAAEGAP